MSRTHGRGRRAALAILSWYAASGRHFAWREVADPFGLVVAEVLLQKTRGEAVAPVWTELMRLYPSPADLLNADPQAVASLVGVLGLRTQRTERLRRAARGLIEGLWPMPGLGTYGNGVLQLADSRLPVRGPVDGNVARVVTRWDGMSFERGEPRKKKEVGQAALSILAGAPVDRRLEVLYALLDLGALVCRARHPDCGSCPLRSACRSAPNMLRIAAASARARGGGTESDTCRI